ncbi:hypothetical protein [Xenophilus sp. Marseille-Q4582]|uniref:hypothetical protein n=1 Tax=Xenophilus sp. Marseille-Q4582 TaxID=2866600 RepID=UPI001CE48ADF|nr:hypothetical protein [Xenophilus sp. Marseille-Q4582]
MTAPGQPRPPARALLAGLLGAAVLTGCAVVSVAGTAVSVGAGAVGLAAEAAIGTARLTGKGVGAAIDAFSDEDDGSGLHVRFREPTSADRAKRQAAEQQARDYDPTQPEAQQALRDAGLAPPTSTPSRGPGPAAPAPEP